MSKEIIVNKGKQTRIAIVENGELAELFIENQEHERTIGNIFLGRIRRVMPSIQAAFVDIGQKQDAFLHFSDLIDNVESWLDYVKEDHPVIGQFKGEYTTKPAGKKRRRPSDQRRGGKGGDHHHVADKKSKDRRKSAHGRQHGSHVAKGRGDGSDEPKFDPTQILNRDQPILVKISKEPIANKGSRITTDISLAGRFLVLVPMANYVAVSKKIMSFKERRRLRALARSLLPEGFGVIVRTVAEDRSAKALDTDLRLLIDKWKKIESKLQANPKPPAGIHEDVNMVSSIMRDLFTEDYDRITIDDQKLYRNIRGYVQAIAPDMVDAVKLEDDANSVFQKAGIKDSVEEAFEDRVNMPSGGYLFIEQTEAMHVIDVNSGRAGRGMSQEDSSLKVNLEAAKIICKQIRLRDLGGIIVVDFIDMRHESNKRKLYEMLKREFRSDRAVSKVLPMSDFGLVQITRQRLRPSITTTFSLPEDGAIAERGAARASRKMGPGRATESRHLRVEPEDLLHKIEEWLGEYREAGRSARVRLRVHPFTASFLSGKFPSRTFRWRLRYGVKVQIDADPSVDPMSFRFFDGATGKEISRLPKQKDRNSKRGSSRGSASEGKQRQEKEAGSGRSSRSKDSSRSGGSRSSSRTGGSENQRSGGRSVSAGKTEGSSSGGAEKSSSRGRGSGRRDDRNRNDRSRDDRKRDDQQGGDRQRADQKRESASGRSPEKRQESRQSERGGGRDEGKREGGRGRSRSENAGNDQRSDSQKERRREKPAAEAKSDGSQRRDSKPEGEAVVRKDAKPDSKAEVRTEAQTESKPDTKSAAKPESKSDTRSRARSEEKPTERPTPKSDEPSGSKSADADKGGEKQAPSQTMDTGKTSDALPASNRFVKIDLTSGGGS